MNRRGEGCWDLVSQGPPGTFHAHKAYSDTSGSGRLGREYFGFPDVGQFSSLEVMRFFFHMAVLLSPPTQPVCSSWPGMQALSQPSHFRLRGSLHLLSFQELSSWFGIFSEGFCRLLWENLLTCVFGFFSLLSEGTYRVSQLFASSTWASLHGLFRPCG